MAEEDIKLIALMALAGDNPGGSVSLSGVLLADGTIPLTADWDVGSFKITAEQFESDVATGTAPLIVASTTKVANLNADLLDGVEGDTLLSKSGGTMTGDIEMGGTSQIFLANGTITDPAITFANNTDIGFYYDGSASLRLSVNSVQIARYISNRIEYSVPLRKATQNGITASTTQAQGQQPLTGDINEISTVANANDTVTMMAAAVGADVVIINNGANTLQIFPASGDDLGSGVDNSITLASGSNLHIVSYDATNWEII